MDFLEAYLLISGSETCSNRRLEALADTSSPHEQLFYPVAGPGKGPGGLGPLLIFSSI